MTTIEKVKELLIGRISSSYDLGGPRNKGLRKELLGAIGESTKSKDIGLSNCRVALYKLFEVPTDRCAAVCEDILIQKINS